MLPRWCAVLTVLFVSGTILADNFLESCQNSIRDEDYGWDSRSRIIAILHGDGNYYKFLVHDGSGEPGSSSMTITAGTTYTASIEPRAGSRTWANLGDCLLRMGSEPRLW